MTEKEVECLFLSKSEVESLLTRKDVLGAIEDSFKGLKTGQTNQPQKVYLWTDAPRNLNFIIAMPAHIKSKNVAGIKWASLYRERGGYDIPTAWGSIIVLNRPETGMPYAIMDGTAITNARTAGGHAVVAAKYLAKKDSKTLAIIGCGAEAYHGFPAFMDNFPLELVKICDIKSEAMTSLQKEMAKEFSVQIFPTTSAQEAVKGADIVLMITSVPERPKSSVVLEPWIEPGCFVAGVVGFYDLDPALGKKADKWVLGERESDIHIHFDEYKWPLSLDDIYADMGEIILGTKPGRENDQERIVYTHMGAASHDIELAHTIYNKAVEKGTGSKVRLI